MRNIEIKARLKDIAEAEAVAQRLAGPSPHAHLHQIDTYFKVRSGRLKLRESSGDKPGAELLFYRREDHAGPKRSNYELIPVPDPALLKSVLASALGISVVVEKDRTVYLYKNVRIHLDKVTRLGSFLEFEAVMPDGTPDEEGKHLLQSLLQEFSVAPEDLIDGSYSDMLMKTPKKPRHSS
jgi:predicted adenylyl cyclase CyaB